MTTDAITRCGDAVAVFDGPRRIHWHRCGPCEWIPLSIWPDEEERREIWRHIADGRPLLVVLDESLSVVPLLLEELAAAGDAVIARVEGRHHRDPMHVRIRALDWLPDDLRRRGLHFLEASVRQAAGIPVPMRPALVLEDPEPAGSPVRFAHRLRSSATLDHHMDAIIAQAFSNGGQAAPG